MIEARGLTKRYGSTVAVNDLSFQVEGGRVTGFLGPNGAGKSTTMRMVLGLDHADARRRPHRRQAPGRLPRAHAHVGALLDASYLHPTRKAKDHLWALAASNGLPRKRVDHVLGLVGLSEVANKRVGAFSLGMKQRLGLAAAMLGDPQTVLFDEPANGLDPEGILWMRQFLKGLANEGRTVFVSSHLLSEMALVADDLVVIGKGELIFQGPVGSFIDGAAKTWVSVRSPQIEQLADALHRAGHQVTAAGPGAVDVVGTDVGDHRRARRRARRHAPRAQPPLVLARGRVPRGHRRRPGVPRHRRRRRAPATSPAAAAARPRPREAHRDPPHPRRVDQVPQRPLHRHHAAHRRRPRRARGRPDRRHHQGRDQHPLRPRLVRDRRRPPTLPGADGGRGFGNPCPDGLQAVPDAHNLTDLTVGVSLACLLFGVLGVQVIGQEYRFNTIRPTFTAAPRRLPVVLAKLIVVCSAVRDRGRGDGGVLLAGGLDHARRVHGRRRRPARRARDRPVRRRSGPPPGSGSARSSASRSPGS